MNLLQIFTKSLQDFLTKEMLFLSLAPAILSLVVWAILFLALPEPIDGVIRFLLDYIPFSDNVIIASVADFILSLVLFLMLFLTTAMILLSFVSDRVVGRINERHYNFSASGFATFNDILRISVGANFRFLFTYILLLPTLFIPILNIIVHIYLWQRLLKTQMLFDAVSPYSSKEEYAHIQQEHSMGLTFLATLSSLLFFIPFFGTFVLIFQLILFTHFGLSKLNQGK
jgi:hypothetical protein